MSDLQIWQALLARLEAGEPLRIIIGERLDDAAEVVPGPNWLAGLRRTLIAEAQRVIAALTPPPGGGSAAPAVALPVPEAEPAEISK